MQTTINEQYTSISDHMATGTKSQVGLVVVSSFDTVVRRTILQAVTTNPTRNTAKILSRGQCRFDVTGFYRTYPILCVQLRFSFQSLEIGKVRTTTSKAMLIPEYAYTAAVRLVHQPSPPNFSVQL